MDDENEAKTGEYANTQNLELQGVIGFNGQVPNGLVLHPGDKHIIYPLGSTIVVKHLLENTQTFLQKGGHNREVSCLALSTTGKYLASGQVTHMGFPALVIIWNLETYEIVHKLVLHKGKIQDLAFSPREKYLATLGGRDDNKLVVWDVKTGEAICGASAANETALCVRFLNNRDDMLVTGGNYNLRVWAFDLANRKIRPSDCHLGQLKRVIDSISIDADDEYMYCGTKTGDLLQVSLGPKLFKASGPKKRPFSLGITCTLLTRKGNMIVGCGDGTIVLMKKDSFRICRRTKVHGGVTSLCLNAAGDHFFVGTDTCSIYLVQIATFDYELRNTCHFGRINDIAFPKGYSELFATCAETDIRVWHATTRNELLRIQVPNLTCLCVCFSQDGKSIVSGWDDGKIRAFLPQSGKLLYAINDAHRDGVTAITTTADCRRVISGGQGGQVRVWAIGRQTQKMIASMKEHKGPVNSVRVNEDDTECVSASADGSCIVWSLERFVRNSCLFASTQFKSIIYHPDQSQLLTTGTDRKLTYWDVVDANPIRIIDGSQTDTINCIDISEDGNVFVSGGGEKLVKLWGYDEGYCYYTGVGHSGEITQARISPDQRTIITVGDEGAIFLWTMPQLTFTDPLEAEEAAAAAAQAEAQNNSIPAVDVDQKLADADDLVDTQGVGIADEKYDDMLAAEAEAALGFDGAQYTDAVAYDNPAAYADPANYADGAVYADPAYGDIPPDAAYDLDPQVQGGGVIEPELDQTHYADPQGQPVPQAQAQAHAQPQPVPQPQAQTQPQRSGRTPIGAYPGSNDPIPEPKRRSKGGPGRNYVTEPNRYW